MLPFDRRSAKSHCKGGTDTRRGEELRPSLQAVIDSMHKTCLLTQQQPLQQLLLQPDGLESKSISNYEDEHMDRQAVNVTPTPAPQVDQPPLFPGCSIPQNSISLCLLPPPMCNKTSGLLHTPLQGAPRDGSCYSQNRNLSMLISFPATLLTIPKEKDGGGRCKGSKSHNQSRWESQNWHISFLSRFDISRGTEFLVLSLS